MKRIFYFLMMTLLFIDLHSNAQQKSPVNSVDRSNEACVKIDDYLTQLSKEKNFSGGLLIIKDGKSIFTKGYGYEDKEQKRPFTSTTLASIGSITKFFTAAAIMKLVEEGKLSSEDNLKKYFSNVPADKSGVTIHQLLTHSSGFHEFLQDDQGDYEKIETEKYLTKAFGEPLAFKPGEKPMYTNVGYSILGIIIEKVSGMNYEKYLQTKLFDPLDIHRIGYHYPLKEGETIAVGYKSGQPWGTHQSHYKEAGGGPYWNLKANGGLEASLADMYVWLNAFSNSTILKKETIEKMYTPYIVEVGNGSESWFGYGCNISKSRRNTKMINNGGSNGIYFAHIIRLPEEGVTFYMVTNESTMGTNNVLPNVTQLYFKGKIEQDALAMSGGFEHPLSKEIYELVLNTKSDLGSALIEKNIKVDDDMILMEVGRKLKDENNIEKQLVLFEYYTKAFPHIVFGWNELGDLYLGQDRKDDAIQCYRMALKLRPENPRAKNALAKLGQ